LNGSYAVAGNENTVHIKNTAFFLKRGYLIKNRACKTAMLLSLSKLVTGFLSVFSVCYLLLKHFWAASVR